MRIAALALCLIALLLAASACGSLRFNTQHGGSASDGSAGVPLAAPNGISGGGDPPPSLSDLQAFLDAELVRLGKFPVAATSVAGVCIDDPVAATSVADYAHSARRLKPPPLDVSAVGAGLAPPSLPIVTEGGMNAAPTRTAAAAPQGQDNAVFDLSAAAVDADGDPLTPEDISGGAVVSAIKLTWTEQLSGDYDQNGEVNVGDLTPLAQHWMKTVTYDDPAAHGGFSRWPSGNPDDPPVVASDSSPPLDRDPAAATSVADSAQSARRLKPPPLEVTAVGADCVRPSADARSASLQVSAASANNWRLARVDGDANGEINLADVTPIAVHWQEAMSGYRLYRKAPGESAFTALADGGAASIAVSALSLERPGSVSGKPPRYLFTDTDAPALPGVYLYYCAPFDPSSLTEGPASGIVSIDIATGATNSAPIAKLKVSPSFGGAPVAVTLDASGSYDPDGSLAELEWDIDSDGMTDLLATDATPPNISTAGLATAVDTLAPGGAWPPPIVTANYVQGVDEWLYPKVRAIDDQSLAGAWQSVQLGVSGWVLEKLYDETERRIDFEVNSVYPGAVSRDPTTGEAVVVGTNNNAAVPTALEGLYIAWREGPGQWRQERIVAYDDPVWQIDAENRYGLIQSPRVQWVGSQAVVIFFSLETNSSGTAWLAFRGNTGDWELTKLPPGFTGIENGRQLSSMRSTTLLSKKGVNASPADWWILDLDASGWSVEETGYTSSGFPGLDASPPWAIAMLGSKLIATLPYNTAFTTSQIPILTETAAPPWQLTAADAGELAGHSFACLDVQITPGGEWYLCAISDSASTSTYAVNSLALISGYPGNFKYTQIRDYILQFKSCYLFVDGPSATMFSVDSSGIPETNGFNSVFYDRLEPQGQLSETIFKQGESDLLFLTFRCGFSFSNGGAFCTLEHGDKKQGGADETDLGIRVDPRF